MFRPRRLVWRPRRFWGPRLRGWGCGLIGLLILFCILAMLTLNILLRHL